MTSEKSSVQHACCSTHRNNTFFERIADNTTGNAISAIELNVKHGKMRIQIERRSSRKTISLRIERRSTNKRKNTKKNYTMQIQKSIARNGVLALRLQSSKHIVGNI
jgi:hypothetical protein